MGRQYRDAVVTSRVESLINSIQKNRALRESVTAVLVGTAACLCPGILGVRDNTNLYKSSIPSRAGTGVFWINTYC